MEEQKKSNGGLIAIIIIACVFIFVILPIGGVMFFWLGWPAIQKSVNEQWNEIIEEQMNNDKPIIEDDEPTLSNSSTLDKTIDGKVVIYLFRGQGCPHCTDAENWIESIKKEYGYMFIVKNYEVWYDADNAELMEKVAESRDEEVMGVPYIVIGDK